MSAYIKTPPRYIRGRPPLAVERPAYISGPSAYIREPAPYIAALRHYIAGRLHTTRGPRGYIESARGYIAGRPRNAPAGLRYIDGRKKYIEPVPAERWGGVRLYMRAAGIYRPEASRRSRSPESAPEVAREGCEMSLGGEGISPESTGHGAGQGAAGETNLPLCLTSRVQVWLHFLLAPRRKI